jgi:hypothetical protein
VKFTIPSLARQFVPVFRPVPAFATPGGTMFFAASGSGGGDGGYDDPEGEPDYTDQPTRRAPGAPREAAEGGGNSGGSGRQRTIDFQPEERYWTEYLRIALPIIGLLLMIGLFWFWASQLANGDDPDDPVATTTPGSTIIVTAESTPEPTEETIIPPTTEPEPTDEPESTPADEEEPTEEPEESTGGFEPLQGVVVTEEGDGVNLRADASTASESLGTLPAGTVLEIQDGPFEADGYVWWEVVVSSGDLANTVGFIAEDFIESAED